MFSLKPTPKPTPKPTTKPTPMPTPTQTLKPTPTPTPKPTPIPTNTKTTTGSASIDSGSINLNNPNYDYSGDDQKSFKIINLGDNFLKKNTFF